MTDPSEIISKHLYEKFNDRDDSFWERQIGRYHASDFGKCLRKSYYEHTLGKRESEGSYPHFQLGNLVENFVEEALASHYGSDSVKNSFRIELDYDDFRVVGQTDPVVVGPNAEPEKIFEVKSTKNISFREEGPSKHHVMQVHPYMKALGLDSCTFIYVQKTDLSVISHEISFSEGTFSEGLERIKSLHEDLVRHGPPPSEPFMDFECRFCSYKDKCERDG